MTVTDHRTIQGCALRDDDLVVIDGCAARVAYPLVRTDDRHYEVTLVRVDTGETFRTVVEQDDQVPCALSRQQEIDLRAQAVQLVDGRHGYTMEFAACPQAHSDDYDIEEQRLRAAALTPALAGR
jgi:hypothetical protein